MTERLDPLVFPLRGSRLIEASAGTGKTWTIAALYLRLVLGHGGPERSFARALAPQQILVMTFTIAATRELSDRIRSRLVEAAAAFRLGASTDPLIDGLMAAYPSAASRDEAAWRLATAAESMDDAAVFTIDAWVQRMLREHAFDSGSLFDEELQPDASAMLVEAVRDYWRQQVYPMDRAATDGVRAVWADVDALIADMRVLTRYVPTVAVANETLASVWRGVRDERRAALVRLKSGWIERVRSMRTWIHAQLGMADHPFNGSRLKRSLCDGWLDAIERWAVDADAVEPAISERAVWRLSTVGLTDALKSGRVLEMPSTLNTLAAAVDATQRLVPPDHAMRRHAAAHVAARLQVLKQRAGAWDFDDMLVRLDRALSRPDGERLRRRIVAQYPVAMIDEFQDTSPLQYRVFDRLYRTAADDPDTALILIGDPKQSIFAFRGADIGSYLRASRETEGRHYLLTTNFRSATGLVDAVNRLFGQAEGRGAGAFRLGPDEGGPGPLPFLPVDAHGLRETLHDGRGRAAALTVAFDDEPVSSSEALRRFADHCAEHVVRTLDDPQAGFVADDGTFTRVRPADITILVRRHHEATLMRAALRARRVPSVYLSIKDSVFAGDHAADLLHWLRAVSDPFDTRLARVAYATRLVGLSLAQIACLSHDDLAFEARVDVLKQLNGEWRRQGVLPMLRRTLHLLDLPARWLAAPDGERKLTDVLHLAELLQTASATLDGEQALIRWLGDQIAFVGEASDERILRLESDADLVKVVTIHTAKGLEYPIVCLPFVCGFRKEKWAGDAVAIVPDDHGDRIVVFAPDEAAKQRVVLADRQEDLRLLYVATTRAKHALWLGVAALKDGNRCSFAQSAFGYLFTGGVPIEATDIEGRLRTLLDTMTSARLDLVTKTEARTRLRPSTNELALVDAPVYAARFERDWSIGSFSAFVRDLGRLPAAAVMVDPAVEEELLAGPQEAEASGVATVARHRFPRGALAGNFLHDQLEWLAAHRFALNDDPGLQDQLSRRCERQGWGARAGDVVTWMREVVAMPLPPIGVALDALPRSVPEMEFWFPVEGIAARRIDALCRAHLLAGRDRPPLPERALRGMLMGFADLVFEIDGRYWVLDYKSNALGDTDADYTADALAASMADHRYDVQAAIYLLALHRLLRQRLGDDYVPERQLGGALYLFLRGIRGPVRGCHVVAPSIALLDGLDAALSSGAAA